MPGRAGCLSLRTPHTHMRTFDSTERMTDRPAIPSCATHITLASGCQTRACHAGRAGLAAYRARTPNQTSMSDRSGPRRRAEDDYLFMLSPSRTPRSCACARPEMQEYSLISRVPALWVPNTRRHAGRTGSRVVMTCYECRFAPWARDTVSSPPPRVTRGPRGRAPPLRRVASAGRSGRHIGSRLPFPLSFFLELYYTSVGVHMYEYKSRGHK